MKSRVNPHSAISAIVVIMRLAVALEAIVVEVDVAGGGPHLVVCDLISEGFAFGAFFHVSASVRFKLCLT